MPEREALLSIKTQHSFRGDAIDALQSSRQLREILGPRPKSMWQLAAAVVCGPRMNALDQIRKYPQFCPHRRCGRQDTALQISSGFRPLQLFPQVRAKLFDVIPADITQRADCFCEKVQAHDYQGAMAERTQDGGITGQLV